MLKMHFFHLLYITYRYTLHILYMFSSLTHVLQAACELTAEEIL